MPSSFPLPADACRFTKLTLVGFSHTWLGDVQIVLQSPTGRKYNIVHRPGFDGSNSGSSADSSNTNLEFVSSSQSAYGPPPSNGPWTSGTYTQSFGTGAGYWPAGANAIENIDLGWIGVETGIWSLAVYDWAAGDTGSLFGWLLEGVRGVPAHFTGGSTPIPASGTGGGGAWPISLPPSQASTFSIYTPVSFVKVTKVSIEGLSHTYVGDLQITLRAPGMSDSVNLAHRPGFTGTGNGNAGDCTGGGYAFVSPVLSANTVPASGNWVGGQYRQHYGTGGGTWPAGVNAIYNHSIESVRGWSGGAWQLEVFDWANGDSGSISSWSLDGYYLPTGPTSYCTSGTSTHGCVPTLLATGTPSVSSMWPCSVQVVGVEGQKSGMIFYGIRGTTWVLWGNSVLCVRAPTQRTAALGSGGTIDTCQGSLSLDWNLFRSQNPAALGQPFQPGESVFFQGWYRDPPSSKGTQLTNAIELTHLP